MKKTLSVSAIQHGTVIDHISHGQGWKMIHLLELHRLPYRITLGINLPSKRLTKKDILKVEHVKLNLEQTNQVSLFAPIATINYITDYQVTEKLKSKLPHSIQSIIGCPNQYCITNHENIKTYFTIEEIGPVIELCCKYCRKKFLKDQIKEFIHD